MDYREALEIVIARTGHERYRALVAEDNPDLFQRDAYREAVIRQAGGQPDPPPPRPAGPPLSARIAGLVRAAVHVARSRFRRVPRAEFERRRALCHRCEFFDADRVRCLKCGCHLAVKPWAAALHCPIEKW